MSLYVLIWILMCLICIKDIIFDTNKRIKGIEFEIGFAVLAFMLIFRYGQGTDYFNYLLNYTLLPEYGIDVSRYHYIHGELGWLLWGNVFRAAGLPYVCFVASVSIVQLLALHRFARIYDIRNCLVLLWAYPTLYLTYFYSGMRQGLVIAVFLGFMLPMLQRNHYVGYILLAVVLVGIHSGAVILLLLPAVMRIKVSTLQILTVINWGGGIIVGTPLSRAWIGAIDADLVRYYTSVITGTPSWFAICERIIFLVVISACYRYLSRTNNHMQLDVWYRCYLFSMAVYGALCWHGYLASRFGVITRYVEILFICMTVSNLAREKRRLVIGLITLYTGIMMFKNIDSYCSQGGYRETVSVWNYPYVSIFNREKLFEVANVSQETVQYLESCTSDEVGTIGPAQIRPSDS